jgi:DNA mismatch repair protein MutL
MESTKSKIHLLDSSVIEKIAAGEVIERPASVLKELVENAIDAQANHIEIFVEDGGFSSISVSDNGSGMTETDLNRCLLRHTTSKITSADDLFAIATMGFRGEALASIAAVSKVSIISSAGNTGEGFLISPGFNGTMSISPAGRTQGTTVTCKELFYNVPARKKFMKSVKAERMTLVAMLDHLVLSFPGIHFTCTIDGKRAFDLPTVDTFHKRIAQVAGSEFAKKLIYATQSRTGLSVEIYLSDPANASMRPHFQNLYVNLRRIDNDSVLWAIREAFSRFIMGSLKPAWFCFLTVDPARIDVNVHPTKQRIKFDDEKELFSFIYGTVHTKLSSIMTSISDSKIHQVPMGKTMSRFDLPGATPPVRSGDFRQSQYGNSNPVQPGVMESFSGTGDVPAMTSAPKDSEQMALSFLSLSEETKKVFGQPEAGNSSGSDIVEGASWNLIQCFQINKMFILAPIKNGILIIDQHAAHERILYEEALEDIKLGRSESQRLLFPVVFELTRAEKEVALSCRNNFTMLGFDVQDFGGLSLAVSAMPATGFIKSTAIEEAIREIVSSLIEEKDRELLSDPQRRFAASFACGAAIKFGQELRQEEMNTLLNSLFATKDPYICPHGRPTLIRISIDELFRRFLR